LIRLQNKSFRNYNTNAFSPVLRIRDVYPGSAFSNPDPGSASKIFKYFNPKNFFEAFGNMVRVVHPGSRILIFTHPGSMGQIGHRIPDPDPQLFSFLTSEINLCVALQVRGEPAL
jgi:hypothetical protein